MSNPLAQDLDHILAHTDGLWDELRGQRLFITGGTGFFGCWLLESFCWANDKLGLGASACVLTRNPDAFRAKAPHLAGHPSVRLCPGQVHDFVFPEGDFSCIIHAATESALGSATPNPIRLFEADIQGTRHVLEFARGCRARRFLFTSSGAVYGRQPPSLTHIPEDYPGAPDTADPLTFYGQAKRVSEYLCTSYGRQYGFDAMIARCFAFVGPYMPFDSNLAVGNFIRDAASGGPIRVRGDGTPCRSYLYAADLAIWLWTMLLRGRPSEVYNVGSEMAVTIADMAREVAVIATSGTTVVVAGVPVRGQPPARYVPAVGRARTSLGLEVWIPRAEGIRRTVAWHARTKCAGISAT